MPSLVASIVYWVCGQDVGGVLEMVQIFVLAEELKIKLFGIIR